MSAISIPHIWTPPKWLGIEALADLMAHLQRGAHGHLTKNSGGHLVRAGSCFTCSALTDVTKKAQYTITGMSGEPCCVGKFHQDQNRYTRLFWRKTSDNTLQTIDLSTSNGVYLSAAGAMSADITVPLPTSPGGGTWAATAYCNTNGGGADCSDSSPIYGTTWTDFASLGRVVTALFTVRLECNTYNELDKPFMLRILPQGYTTYPSGAKGVDLFGFRRTGVTDSIPGVHFSSSIIFIEIDHGDTVYGHLGTGQACVGLMSGADFDASGSFLGNPNCAITLDIVNA